MDTNRIKTHIEEFLNQAAMKPSSVDIREGNEDGGVWISVVLDEPRLTPENGNEIIQAINHLVNKMMEKELGHEENTLRVTVDINGHQQKRIENLKTIAHMMAERARFFKSSIELDPMSSYERRVVHEFLSDTKDVKTESTGEGRGRRVVIRYIESQ